MTKAMAPAPGRNMSEHAKVPGTVHTKGTSPGMLDTFPNVRELDGWLTPVAPDYLAGFSEVLLMVCESNEVFERGNRTPGGEPEVRRGSRNTRPLPFFIRTRLGCASVAVLNETHGRVNQVMVPQSDQIWHVNRTYNKA